MKVERICPPTGGIYPFPTSRGFSAFKKSGGMFRGIFSFRGIFDEIGNLKKFSSTKWKFKHFEVLKIRHEIMHFVKTFFKIKAWA